MTASKGISVASGNTSSSAEMLSSESKEVVSSIGKVEGCEISATQVVEFTISSSFATQERRSGWVMREPSLPELSYAWPSAED